MYDHSGVATIALPIRALSYEKPIEIHLRMVENKDLMIGNTNILPGMTLTVQMRIAVSYLISQYSN